MSAVTDEEVEAACKAFGSPFHTRSESDLRTDMRAALEPIAAERAAMCELYRHALLMFASLLSTTGAASEAGKASAVQVRAWADRGVLNPDLFDLIHEHSRAAVLDASPFGTEPDVERN